MGENMMFLIAGENGEAPLLEILLGDKGKVHEMLTNLLKEQESLKLEHKAVMTQQNSMSRGGTEGMKDLLKQFSEIQKKLNGVQKSMPGEGHPFGESEK